MDNKCNMCGRDSAGYKCDMCGDEAKEHDQMHGCGGDHCMPKCSECGKAEAQCNCPPVPKE